MKIAAIVPSRGLVFSETVEELQVNLQHSGYAWDIYWAHGRPIPACFNEPLELALRDKRNHYFWFVEEDMILGYDILDEMMAALHKHNAPAVSIDYPVSGDGHYGTVLYDKPNKAFFTGTGCLLVRRSALEKLPRPIFRSDVGFTVKLKANALYAEAYKIDNPRQKGVYGMHDIYFGFQMYLRDMPIHILKGELGQRKLRKLGEGETNFGYHSIEKLTGVKKNVFMILNAKYGTPPPDTGMEEVKDENGKVFFIRKTHHQTLDTQLADAYERHGNLIIANKELLDG
jgi:hypothetical protein